VRALGDLDELNSAIGLVLAEDPPAEVSEALSDVQHDLFDLGGEVSIPGHAILGEAQVERLEATSSAGTPSLPALKEFILPGGTRSAAAAHLARTICRRAERSLVRARRAREGGRAGAALPEPPLGPPVHRRSAPEPRRRPHGRAMASTNARKR